MSRASFIDSIAPGKITHIQRAHEHLTDVVQEYGIGQRDILGKDRSRHIVRPRFDWWHRCRKDGLSLPQIAAIAGRDHTSILNGLRRHEELSNE
jgi:chromosomal replication initiation ATPase DnaA